MLSIMTFCPKTAANGHANICVRGNKKLNPKLGFLTDKPIAARQQKATLGSARSS
jgi:hypothetical protein